MSETLKKLFEIRLIMEFVDKVEIGYETKCDNLHNLIIDMIKKGKWWKLK